MGGTMIFLLAILFLVQQTCSLNSAWRWACIDGTCKKRLIQENETDTALSLSVCQLLCHEDASIWPKPTGSVSFGNYLAKININSIDVLGLQSEAPNHPFISGSIKHFKDHIQSLQTKVSNSIGRSLVVQLNIINNQITQLTLDTDESYHLNVSEGPDGRIFANIKADNMFGARHGLETLSQIIVVDDLRDEIVTFRDVDINDKPVYHWRGILLDTSRNYVSVPIIKNIIKGMGASKLNRFHWHITDSHSFPWVSKSIPELSKIGAYSPKKVYTTNDVSEVIKYGLEMGVSVVPEFDAPAHVGEGWQNTEFVTCFNHQPWREKCVEPPCGQFDPTNDKLYDILENLYGDLLEQFKPDVFHMGGDEVNINCWNTTNNIVEWMKNKGWNRSEEDFIKLWNHFQSNAVERVYKKAGKQLPIIMWTSYLTQKEYIHYLPKDQYIIQIWTLGTDVQIKNLIDGGYRLILSNYDALYLDCGFAGWVTDGNNWCSPYIGWQKIYENKINKISGGRSDLFLGSEAALWTEQAGTENVEGRIWPRAAAMSEVLWSEPSGTWNKAEQRFLVHRQRLVEKGIAADTIEPEWCLQNEGQCPIIQNSETNRNGNTLATSKLTIFNFCMIVLFIIFY